MELGYFFKREYNSGLPVTPDMTLDEIRQFDGPAKAAWESLPQVMSEEGLIAPPEDELNDARVGGDATFLYNADFVVYDVIDRQPKYDDFFDRLKREFAMVKRAKVDE